MTEPSDENTGEAPEVETVRPAADDFEGPRRRARREREERRAAQLRATAIENARREAKRKVMGGPQEETKRLGRRTVRGL
jgi:cell division protein FtsQ